MTPSKRPSWSVQIIRDFWCFPINCSARVTSSSGRQAMTSRVITSPTEVVGGRDSATIRSAISRSVIAPSTFLVESQTGRKPTFASRMRRAAVWIGSAESTYSTSRFMISSQRIGSSLRPSRFALVAPDAEIFNTEAYGVVRREVAAPSRPSSDCAGLPCLARPRCLAGRRAALGRALRPDRLLCRSAARPRAAAHGGAVCLSGKRRARSRGAGLAPQCTSDGPRSPGRRPPPAAPSPDVPRCLAPGRRRSLSSPWRPQLHTGAPGLRQADCDRLLGRPGPVLALAYMVNLFAHELARLRRR